MYTIYSLRNAQGVFYIGCTVNLKGRMGKHRVAYGYHIRYKVLEDGIETRERAITRENHFIKTMLDSGAKLINVVQRSDCSPHNKTPSKYYKRK